MCEVGRGSETLRVLGDLVESAEPIGWENGEVVEYAVPSEQYESLVQLFGRLNGVEVR